MTESGVKTFGGFLLAGAEFAIPMENLEEVVNEPRQYVVMPLAPPALLGLFSLRGAVLPVLDLSKLLRLRAESSEAGSGKVAVLRRGKARVGVRFDGIREVIRAAADEIQSRPASEAGQPKLVCGVIESAGQNRLIQILDFDALIAVENLPLFETSQSEQDSKRGRAEGRLVCFWVSGSRFALHASLVERIVRPGLAGVGALQHSAHGNELAEETIQVSGREVPVVKLDRLMGLPESSEVAGPVVICRSDGREIGMAVEKLEELTPLFEGMILPIPILSDFRGDLFRGCFLDRTGEPVIVLNGEALLGEGPIRQISQNYGRMAAKAAGTEKAVRGRAARVSILSFRIGGLFGMRILDVREIIGSDQIYARTPGMPKAVLGTISLRGKPVPVVDPRPLFDLPAGEAKDPKILILQEGDALFGMRVDAVENLVAETESTEAALPNLLFQKTQAKLGASFDKAIETEGKEGKKEALVLLETKQILDKLKHCLEAKEVRLAA